MAKGQTQLPKSFCQNHSNYAPHNLWIIQVRIGSLSYGFSYSPKGFKSRLWGVACTLMDTEVKTFANLVWPLIIESRFVHFNNALGPWWLENIKLGQIQTAWSWPMMRRPRLVCPKYRRLKLPKQLSMSYFR